MAGNYSRGGTAISSLLALLLSGCASSNLQMGPSYPPETIRRGVEETSYDFGQRVCNTLGKGIHGLISESTSNAVYQINCEEHGGVEVFDVVHMHLEGRFNYPQPVRLSLDDLVDYARDKKVVLFGEDHGEDRREDAQKFSRDIPKLRETGFTHIALEIDYRLQDNVNGYMRNPNAQNRNQLLLNLPFYDFTKEDALMIIDTAIENGMRVICLDNLNPERETTRDQYMKVKIDEVIENGGRIAAFLGTAHVRWSRESEFRYWGDENISGLTRVHLIKPLGRYLIDSYGKSAVGLVDLTGCDDSYIFTCM